TCTRRWRDCSRRWRGKRARGVPRRAGTPGAPGMGRGRAAMGRGRGLGGVAITGLLLSVGLSGCKGAPPKLPAIPADAGTVMLPPGVASKVPDDQALVDRVVAVVNDEVITMSELQESVVLTLREAKEGMPSDGVERERFVQKVLDRMVDHRLQVQEA